MANTIVGVFDESVRVEEIARALLTEGFSPENLQIIQDDDNSVTNEERLAGLGLPPEQLARLAEELGRGQILLAVNDRPAQAAQLLQRYGGRVVQAGQPGPTAGSVPPGATTHTGDYSLNTQPTGVSNTYTQETATSTAFMPGVQQQGFGPFEEGTLEVPIFAEELVVDKHPFVRREVTVNKQIVSEQQNLDATVRRNEVQVDRSTQAANTSFATAAPTPTRTNVPTNQAGATFKSFDTYSPEFRRHAERITSDANDATYQHLEPAYHYGYDLASDPRFRGQRWETIEPVVSQDWERFNPGSWPQVRDQVHYAWDTVLNDF